MLKPATVPDLIPENPLLDEFCRFVADAIGEDITPERVRRIIEVSNEGLHVAHGVKWNTLYPQVKTEGILPNSCGNSYWTCGTALFGSRLHDNNNWSSYDSTFFHYGHSTPYLGDMHNAPRVNNMTIAVTNQELLRRIPGFPPTAIRQNGYFTLSHLVPPEALCLLRVEMEHGATSLAPRQYGQLIERVMFRLLEKTLMEGYSGGEHSIEHYSLIPHETRSALIQAAVL